MSPATFPRTSLPSLTVGILPQLSPSRHRAVTSCPAAFLWELASCSYGGAEVCFLSFCFIGRVPSAQKVWIQGDISSEGAVNPGGWEEKQACQLLLLLGPSDPGHVWSPLHF